MAEFSLAKRLREEAIASRGGEDANGETCNLLEEAADEIEKLQSQLDRFTQRLHNCEVACEYWRLLAEKKSNRD